MKRNSTFHIFIFLTTLSVFCMPFVTLAEQNFVQIEAKAAAEADADKDVSKLLWLGTGCIVSLVTAAIPAGILISSSGSRDDFGVGAAVGVVAFGVGGVGGCVGSTVGALVYLPTIPTDRFIGKSPEYVRSYTSAYKAETRRLQATYNGIGVGLGTGGCLLLSAIISIQN